MMLLVTADQMREMDRRTIQDIGIPGIVLMERAALGAVEALTTHFEIDPGQRVGILCGGGNNGGDGFAMARMLNDLRIQVWVGAMKSPDGYSGDAQVNADILGTLGIDVVDLSSHSAEELSGVLENVPPLDVWVDAIFGTGLDREVEGAYASAIDFLKTQPRVFAVDIPSGLHADNGQILGTGVRAGATATFGHPKLGMAIYPGRESCGTIYPIDIGIPASITTAVGWEAEWLIGDRWLPSRPPTMHKGEAGRVLAIGGESGKTGALLMTVQGALRSGAGLIVAGTYDDCVAAVAPAVNEVMAAPVLARTLEQSHADELEDRLDWTDIVAIGPGMGTHEGALEVLATVLEGGLDAVVVDADGLTLMAEHRMQIPEHDVDTLVLTPHPGEAARLCGCSVAELLANPVEHALELAEEWDAIVVLKGASTVIAQHEPRRVAVNASGNPGMATGGMGDALTGIIAAQLAETVPAFDSVCTAVWAHGAAGDLAAGEASERGLTVSDLLDALPSVWRGLERP